jgi:hypothetical protein
MSVESTSTPAAPLAEEQFRSASGLRPASAFVLIGFVLALVAARAAIIALHEEGEQPTNQKRLPILPVGFVVTDAGGVPLSGSVDYLELVMSPNAMWQAHTPDAMAQKLSLALGKPADAAALLEKMLPDAERGIVTARNGEGGPLLLDEAQAGRVAQWLKRGTNDPDADEGTPIHGFQLVRANQPGAYGLVWSPRIALSDEERARHGAKKPLEWSRRLADGLGACMLGDAAATIDTDEERASLRSSMWSALMPTQFKSIVKEVGVERAQAVHDLLKEERVQTHQMEIRRNKKRVYPVKGERGAAPAVSVLGRFGTLEPEKARRLAMEDLRLPPDDSLWSAEQLEAFHARADARIFQPSPMSGLELLAKSMLDLPEWQQWLRLRGEEYTFLANQVPRQPRHSYFQELVPGDEPPRVISTIEIGLQRTLRLAIQRTMAENDPALVMAIAIDVATGDVLAVDSVDRYGMGGFLPILHTFTPGSTFKVITMAAALEEGVVTPRESINAHHNTFVFEGRPIHEAEGAKDKDWVTASQGLALSINAVLVQIGTRMSAEAMRRHLVHLGYGQAPKTGLGGERMGTLLALPWSRKYTQASMCFGHEILTTMWQHAAALCTVVRGGHFRPLRIVKAVEQYGITKPVPLVEDLPNQARDSLSARTCEDVREMMMLGAREGTGKKVWRDDMIMGTKTGTAEKTPSELCLHAELQHNQEHDCHGNRACRRGLKGKKLHRGSCYTSSMCIFGRRPEGGREVMVLVIVDEPRGKRHFGSEVAGPAAITILREALGLTRLGEETTQAGTDGFHAVSTQAEGALDQPWAERTHASR